MTVDETLLEVLSELAECGRAMGPYRRRVVLTGGLVPALYRFDDRFDSPRHPALLTKDLDFTVPQSLPIEDDTRLIDLLEEGGFKVVPARTSNPAVPPKHFVQHQRHGTEQLAPIHAEFLVPLHGSSTDRDGNPKSPHEFQSGLNAEALRFLDLLLWRPATFDLSRVAPLDLDDRLEFKIPRPATYILQKALCSKRRSRVEKTQKDLVYIYDVAVLTHRHWSTIQKDLQDLTEDRPAWSKWLETASEVLQESFASSTDIGPLASERMYGEETVKAKSVHRLMKRFIDDVGL